MTEHIQWLLLTVSRFQPVTLLKKRLQQRCFSVSFAKILRTSFNRIPAGNCFLSLSVNFKKFSEHLLYRAILENYLFHVQVAEFRSVDTVKVYFRGAFEAFYKGTWSSFPEAFIYLKCLKIICDQLICNEVLRCQPVRLWKKLFHTFSFMYCAFNF